MLKNFVTTDDLKKHYPNIGSYYPTGYSDYSTTINEAFELVNDEFIAKGYEPRRLMLPLDLARAASSTDDQNVLTSISATAAVDKTHIDGVAGFKRCVLVVTAWAGSTVIRWEGSNDQDIDDDTEPTNWTVIKSWTITATGTVSYVTTEEFHYYRIRVISVASGTTTFTAAIYEVYADRLILWKTLWMIFKYFSKSPDDTWADKANEAKQNYETALESYKMMIDENDDNLVDPDQEKSSVSTQFTL